jgi:hypothetical protein
MALDLLMVDKFEGVAPRQLEWRQYSRSSFSGKQLFSECPGFGDKVPPDLVVRPERDPKWMSPGVSDYLASKEAAWIIRGLSKDWLIRQFKDGIASDTHGSMQENYERERTSRIVADRWPSSEGFIHIPEGLPELPPGPSLSKTVECWLRAKNSGRAISMEDNMSFMGLGNREIQLLGGYETVISNAPWELLARLKPLSESPEPKFAVACDQNVLAGLTTCKAEHEEFGLLLPARESRHITVVAAQHGAGVSRLARRFHQRQVARLDRVGKQLMGVGAYIRGTPDTPEWHREWDHLCDCIARNLYEGWRPHLRVLLTHECPNKMCAALRSYGISSNWILYTPDQAEMARRIASRNVCAGVLRHMASTWNVLYREVSPACELHTEEEVIQIVQGGGLEICASA